jgi:hypothetical protein
MRLTCFATAFLLSGLFVAAQTGGKVNAEGRIAGRALDQRGKPLHRIFVKAFHEETNMYMPMSRESDEDGKFEIERLEPGTYDLFGQSENAGYPDTSLSFYSKEEPTKVALGNGGTATVVLVLGPKAGILTGTIVDRTTGKAVVLQHAPHFVARKLSDPEDSIEFAGPGKFRWLIPPGVEVSLQICAEGYKVWSYSDPSNPSDSLPLRLESGETKILKVELEPDTYDADSADRRPCSNRPSDVR